MAKRKKHQRLPSGWGSIRYLGKGRRNPYAVHPPSTLQDPETGRYITPKALCYVDDWYVGFAVLNAYRAGTYQPGDEIGFKDALASSDQNVDSFVQRILADSGKAPKADRLPTFAEVYAQWHEWKCGPNAPKKLSKSQIDKFTAAYKNLSSIHDRELAKLTVDDLQVVINATDLGKASLKNIKNLLSQVYKWAESRGVVDKDISKHVVIPAAAKEDEHGIPLSEEDIKLLWKNRSDPDCELALCLCYSGRRIGEYEAAEVDLVKNCFHGGLKSEAGKGRSVPIHPAIRDVVKARLARYDGKLLPLEANYHGRKLSKALLRIGIQPRHTAHDCRHTFSMLCERYGVPEADRKRMLGHSFGGDVTNAVYGHRSLEDLRKSICLIPAPDGFVTSV